MLALFRAFAKSWVAKILFAVLVLAFGLWGIQGALSPKISTAVVTAGQRQISESEFRDLVDAQLNRVRQEGGQVPNMEQLLKMGVPQQWAAQLAQDLALQAWIETAGIKPAKSLTTDAIKSNPNLAGAFNPVTGAFDEQTFRAILSQAHLTEATFLQNLHDEIAMKHLAGAVESGAQAPQLYSAIQAEFLMQTRDASFFILNPKALGPLPVPTQADLQKFYTELGDAVRRKETRVLTVVLFDPRTVAASVKVDPAEVQKVFEFRKDSYSVPEKRTFVQITAKDAQAAAAAAKALSAGQSPDAAAKAAGGQASDQKDLAKTSVPDPKVADAVFALKPGQVSAPVHGDLGWAVVKLQSVTPGRAATLEEKRPEIEASLRQRAAQDKISDMVQKYSEARDSGLGAAAAAAKVGAPVKDLPAMTQEGQSYTGEQVNIPQAVLQRILATGFSLPKNGQSEPQQLGGGVYFAIGVKDVHPAYKPSLDEIRPQLTAEWTRRTLTTRLRSKSDELIAQLKKGVPMAQVAASVGAQVQHAADVQRAPSQSADPRALVTAALFSQPKGQPFATPLTATDLLIGEVEAIHPPATVKAAEVVATRGRTATTRTVVQDLLQGVQDAARTQVKPKVDNDNLQTALGVTKDQQQQPSAPAQ
jgi:peptidyl-prolyl cis-trans isomerase D